MGERGLRKGGRKRMGVWACGRMGEKTINQKRATRNQKNRRSA
jgi:hypothetical protein